MITLPAIPEGSYQIIYADPPWSFKTFSAKGEGRSASQHYKTMKLKDICALPVQHWAAKGSVLFMWTTAPHLKKAFKVIEAWGFEYKTVAFTWVKTTGGEKRLFYDETDFCMGTGYWTRANPEICLLATRGKNPPQRISKSVRELIVAPLRQHSRKPDEVPKMIEELMGPDHNFLEMFARTRRPGWDVWGNEVEKFANVSAS